jgi:hypothetical protein
MRFFPVVNLSPRLGQVKEFPILPDAALARICEAVKEYNEWKDWADTPTGDRHLRDAISNVQSMINTVRPDFQKGAAQEISKYCDNSDDLIGHLNVYQGTTTPAIPPSQTPVATSDTSRPQPPPPPPNTNPPVATGQPGPGRGAFGWRPSVATGQFGPGYTPPPETPEPVGTTGSEPEPEPTPPPPMPPPTPPPVASVDNGCWYVMGQGYSWGPRPPSGESTGLNQAACQNIISVDRQVRGLPPLTATPGATVQQQTTSPQTPPMTATQAPAPPKPPPPTPPPVATGGPGSCGPGQFWDGTRCRGSVASLPSLPGGLGPSGGAALPPGGLELPPGLTEGVSGISMGSRIPLVRGIGTRALRGGW